MRGSEVAGGGGGEFDEAFGEKPGDGHADVIRFVVF